MPTRGTLPRTSPACGLSQPPGLAPPPYHPARGGSRCCEGSAAASAVVLLGQVEAVLLPRTALGVRGRGEGWVRASVEVEWRVVSGEELGLGLGLGVRLRAGAYVMNWSKVIGGRARVRLRGPAHVMNWSKVIGVRIRARVRIRLMLNIAHVMNWSKVISSGVVTTSAASW
eukprot:scaffold111924_cov27-Phaeocystis_antarctica.AAC.1